MKVTSIMGVDVSKNTLDCHLFTVQKSLPPVSNDIKGFKLINRWLLKEKQDKKGLLVVMEHTGIYTYRLELFLQEHQINYVKRPALDIKRSVGMVRGKSDKVDARFISKYGWMRKDELHPMSPLSEEQLSLQQLMSHRDKMVSDKASYQSKIKEMVSQFGERMNGRMVSSMEYIMEVLAQEIKETEKAIKSLIKSNNLLQTNYSLVSSVPGIGFATAVHLLITTENFTKFDDVRKMLCYCGVAPFEHSSGTSIRGKTRVSHLANKKLKTLLTMGAISAVQHDAELKAKYEQKINEGKPKMSALNIIRAKLIGRVFAVVKKQEPYEIRIAA